MAPKINNNDIVEVEGKRYKVVDGKLLPQNSQDALVRERSKLYLGFNSGQKPILFPLSWEALARAQQTRDDKAFSSRHEYSTPLMGSRSDSFSLYHLDGDTLTNLSEYVLDLNLLDHAIVHVPSGRTLAQGEGRNSGFVGVQKSAQDWVVAFGKDEILRKKFKFKGRGHDHIKYDSIVSFGTTTPDHDGDYRFNVPGNFWWARKNVVLEFVGDK